MTEKSFSTEILKPIIKKNKDAAVEFAKDSIIISEV
jgi:hypothetical protein